jgi:hypothetical protein
MSIGEATFKNPTSLMKGITSIGVRARPERHLVDPVEEELLQASVLESEESAEDSQIQSYWAQPSSVAWRIGPASSWFGSPRVESVGLYYYQEKSAPGQPPGQPPE